MTDNEELAPPELHPAWREEIERRMADYRAGKSEAIPWEVVEKELDELVDLPESKSI